MCEPPTTSACTNVKTLRPGCAPPIRPRRRTVWLIKHSSERRATSVATNKRPALATRLGSSNDTSIRLIPRDTGLTESASLMLGNCDVEHRNSSSAGGTFRGCAAYVPLSSSVDRGLEGECR